MKGGKVYLGGPLDEGTALGSEDIQLRSQSKANSEKEKPSRNSKKKVIAYETFESSSEDEFSCGAFESAAASFQNKDKEQNTSTFQE